MCIRDRVLVEESILKWTESATVCIVHIVHASCSVCCGVEESILKWTESATVCIVRASCSVCCGVEESIFMWAESATMCILCVLNSPLHGST